MTTNLVVKITVVESWSIKLRCWEDWFLLEDGEGKSVPCPSPSFWWLSAIIGVLACRYITWSLLVFTSLLCFCGLSFSYGEQLSLDLGLTLNQGWSHFGIFKDLRSAKLFFIVVVFPNKITFTGSRGWNWKYLFFLEATIEPTTLENRVYLRGW